MSNISDPPVLLCTTFLTVLDGLYLGSVVGEYFTLRFERNVSLLTEYTRLLLVQFVHLLTADRECDALKHGKILHEVPKFLCMFVIEPTVLFAKRTRGRGFPVPTYLILYACKHFGAISEYCIDNIILSIIGQVWII